MRSDFSLNICMNLPGFNYETKRPQERSEQAGQATQIDPTLYIYNYCVIYFKCDTVVAESGRK